jgi:uncharacterized protein DUF3857
MKQQIWGDKRAMFRFGAWAALLLTVLGLATQEAKAGAGFQPVSQEELKMTSEPLAPGAPAIILYRQVDRDDNGLTSHEDNYFRIKILTDAGRKYADVEVPFVRGVDDLVTLKGRTIKPDGTIVNFEGKVFEKELVKRRFRGEQFKVLAKTFTLPSVEVGSVIEYFYTFDFAEYELFSSNWILSNELFTRKARFSLKPYKGVYASESIVLHWNPSRLPAGTDPPKQGADGILRMEASNIPAFQEEDYMPPPSELKSRVDFYWENAMEEKDAATYWRRIAKERNGQLESFAGKRGAMEQAVAQIISPNDLPEVKLRKIYARVQQFRNTTYEVKKTEQEQKRNKEKDVENVNVEEIWKRGYGNSVQLTWLFLGLARAAGFEAYGCWVAPRNEYFFNPSMTQARKLDANVVLVKLNGKDLYLDPGGAFAPFGLLPWPETGVTGMMLSRDGGQWIQTTIPPASDSRIERAGKLKLSDSGDLEGKLTVTYTGLEALDHRLEERHADEVDRKKYLEERLMEQIGAAAEVELTNKPDWSASETPLVAEFDVKIPGWGSTAGHRVLTPAAVFTASEKGVFEHTSRVHPIYFDYLFEKDDDVTIELPSGWQVSNVPAPQDQNVKVVAYSLKVEPGQGTMRLTRNLTIGIGLLDQKLYGPMRTFFQIVRTGDAEQVVLQPGEIHASN